LKEKLDYYESGQDRKKLLDEILSKVVKNIRVLKMKMLD